MKNVLAMYIFVHAFYLAMKWAQLDYFYFLMCARSITLTGHAFVNPAWGLSARVRICNPRQMPSLIIQSTSHISLRSGCIATPYTNIRSGRIEVYIKHLQAAYRNEITDELAEKCRWCPTGPNGATYG